MNNISTSNIFKTLWGFLEILKNHIKMIIVTTILTVIVFAIAIFFVIKPQYQSTTQMIVNQHISKSVEDSQLQGVQQADVQLVNTYKGIITSPTVSDRVQKRLGYNPVARKSKVSVDTQPNSQVFDISTKSPSPIVAAEVSNQTAKVFKKRLKHVMRSSNASVIARAYPNPSPVFPNKILGLLMGLVVGLVLSIMFVILKEYGTRTVNSVNFITRGLRLKNLGMINDINPKNLNKYAKTHHK